ncbi:SpoIIE family protein phosphatase [Streptomyces liangshanensis]|uniref:protein-serine/threonine phosphatase n=1 Tax=Streptomyces liangshanensis TaxID=2717324 RepID=A0A6G9H7G9_9ACTN|nr:SpoIIE family protein phosphatase [Streptomyces liangshanensis]QIQ06161.1 SpoIIE family protein phosphatase [Streptomyces liangshanensis]
MAGRTSFLSRTGAGLALDSVLERAVHDAGAYAGGVWLLSPSDRKILRLVVTTGIPQTVTRPWERVSVAASVPVADATRERRLVWLAPDGALARHYPRAGLILPYSFAVVAAPLTSGGTTWGALLLLWPGSHPPDLSEAEHTAVDEACDDLAAVCRRAAQRDGSTLIGPRPRILSARSSPPPGPAQALAAVDFAGRLPDGACSLDLDGRIAFISPRAAELVGKEPADLVGALPAEKLPWLSDPVFEDRYRSAVLSQQPMSFTALRPPDTWLTIHLHPDPSGISVVIAPAPSGEPEGAPQPQPPPAGKPPPVRPGTLYHLMHLAASLTEAVGVEDVVELIADQIVSAFDAEAVALMTLQESRLRIIGSHGFAPELLERFDAKRIAGLSPSSVVARTGTARFVATREELAEEYPEVAARTTKAAWAFLPLIASGRAVGVCVLAYDKPHPFPHEERAALTSLAGLIAQALDRGRLYDAKHHLAHGLQEGLLPQTLPEVGGLDVTGRYLPATYGMDIGGDFYDLIRLDDTTVAAVIGDVEGHNVTAAALMGQVRTAVHAYATAGASPDEVLTRTNRLLTDLAPDLSTSCLYVQVDLAAHRARLVTAGHPPPLLYAPDGHAETIPLPPGILLGIDCTATYETVDIPLPPGSLLMMYTDGLVECPGVDMDAAVREVGRRLAHSEDRSLDALADSVLRPGLCGPVRNDDIALLLLRAPADPGRLPGRA